MRSLLLKISSLPSNIKWITAGLILILLFLLTLIYLNILPLYKFLPAMFQPFSPTPTKVIINCPVPQEFCKNSKPIIYQGKIIGLGFSLPEGTTLKTVFPGTLENGVESGEKLKIMVHPLRWLHGKDKFTGYTATYNFFGTPVFSFNTDKVIKTFSLGETLATSSAQSFPKEEPYNGVNFIFSLTKGDKYGQPIDFEFK